MRRRVLAVLISLESAILCAIVASSLELSRDVQHSASAHRFAHAVVRTTQQLAARISQATLD